ncbi:SDR family oxidoreductase [Geminocystis herdmanii]|uniref:SDR family oxidoreductase n=1 Tax=Geminocystis herdmanii TaxID=669359 RepID=UPI000348674C|nr:SDR family oxidoreductase [Geminocystis herdmanii]
MKTLIIGASGLVGYHLLQTTKSRGWDVTGTYHNYQLPELSPLETIQEQKVRSLIFQIQPEIIFLPAFLSNVNYCETNSEESHLINVEGSLNVIKASKEIGAKLVFYSSDYVFDGQSGPYKETDLVNPICVYGKQKLEVENLITKLLDDYLLLRITVVYGYELQGKNFVTRLIKSLQNKEIVKVPMDQIGSPTLVNDIAEASCRLVETKQQGLFHVAGVDVISRYDFALKVADVFNLDCQYVIPIDTPSLHQLAPRPLKAGMICDKLSSTLNWNLKGTIEGLNFYGNDEKF